MTEHYDGTTATTERERDLELEVARLTAELETLRGDDESAATTRLLAMASQTVDRVVADARREADEIVVEVSAQAEARRDEATRVAAEAEAMAEKFLAEADKAQEVIDEASEEAATIRAEAEEVAAAVAVERERVDAEEAALEETRAMLEAERDTIELSAEDLRRRVQELATSIVTFMSADLPDGETKIEDRAVPQLESVLTGLDDSHDDDDYDDVEFDFEDDAVFEFESTSASEPGAMTGSVDETGDLAAAAAAAAADELWTEMLASAIPSEDRIVDVPDTSIDEVPEGPGMRFGGVPVVEPVDGEDSKDDKPASGGLFSRARAEVTGFEDLAAEADDDDETSLFGTYGPRLLQQASPSELADALEADESEDQAFRQFIDGDNEPDPSRDWLLRPEQS